MIQTRRELAGRLTVHEVSGGFSLDEIESRVKQFYSEGPTPLILWDLTRARGSRIDSRELRVLADGLVRFQHSREGGRTAIACSKDALFGLGRMYEVFSQLAEHIAEVRVFRDTEDARSWLLASDSSRGSFDDE